MGRWSAARAIGVAVCVLAAVAAAHAATRTYVSLAGRDDSIPKLGRPGIAVKVAPDGAPDAAIVAGELARELAAQVHTRRLQPDDPGDYALTITLNAPQVEGTAVTVPFEAVLASPGGERLWRIDGRADVTGAPLDTSVYAGIGRNVVSALIHDGWVQPRYDPDDPPPPPPHVR